MDINKYIGNKIRNLREQRNLTQEEIAEYLNTTPQTISRYEIGDRKKLIKIFYLN
ncbi:MAG: helix-turn-helix domain-containing protein [Clostridium sp.]|nr:MAG: helix-turn-helix domain-containing protein [Clostridium sp.]